MDINQIIRDHSSQPITHQLLMSFLKDYKRPNDKIKALKADGVIESIKKGLYIAGSRINKDRPDNGLIANQIYGPSYVSLETALSYYGLIPERVYETTSMTTKVSKEFNTPVGLFTYTHLPLPYYAFGLNMIRLSTDSRGIIASPEKALCDKIITTPGILIRSPNQAAAYLIENLRIEEVALKDLNVEMIAGWLTDAPKKDSLEMLIKLIRSL